MSPFLSIRTLAIDLLNQNLLQERQEVDATPQPPSLASSVLGYLVRERLESKEAIKHIKCPCFIIHGLRDTLVPYTHAKQLHELCGTARGLEDGRSGTECSLLLSASMSHNEFDMERDFLEPVGYFM